MVGAGPSGSVLAGLLAERGRAVLLLERWHHPRPKPCGEFINPGAVAALRRTGFGPDVEALHPPRIEGWRIHSWSGVTIRADFADQAGSDIYGWGLSRARLDAALAYGARARGAALHEGRTVTSVSVNPHMVRVMSGHGADERVDTARFVVGADGLRSRTARLLTDATSPGRRRRVSLSAHVRGTGPDPTRGWLRIGGSRTVGIAAIEAERGLWNVTVVTDPRTCGEDIKADPRAFLLETMREASPPWEAPPSWVEGPWASGPFELRQRRVAGSRWALVGDAAGYFDPLTGQGVHQAVRSAELAANHIEVALAGGGPGGDLSAYARQLRRELTPVRRVQRMVASVVEGPNLGGALLSRLAQAPGSATALVRVTGDWARSRTLLRPSAWAPLLIPRVHS